MAAVAHLSLSFRGKNNFAVKSAAGRKALREAATQDAIATGKDVNITKRKRNIVTSDDIMPDCQRNH